MEIGKEEESKDSRRGFGFEQEEEAQIYSSEVLSSLPKGKKAVWAL